MTKRQPNEAKRDGGRRMRDGMEEEGVVPALENGERRWVACNAMEFE